MHEGLSPLAVTSLLWVAWVVSWSIAAAWTNQTTARLRSTSELLYRIVTQSGLVLLLVVSRTRFAGPVFWTTPPAVGWVLVGVTVAAFAFCWWARIHLGRLWSSSVTHKADHHIVDTGPYAFVRHPIYTGLILSSLALAPQNANLIALSGLTLVITGYWIKARYEERFLRSQLGADAYDSYARRTGMLFPGL